MAPTYNTYTAEPAVTGASRSPRDTALGCSPESAASEADSPGVMDGNQGNSARSKPKRVNPVPPRQHRSALVLTERSCAEEQFRVQEPEHVRGGSSANGRTGSRHHQGGPGAWSIPACHEGTEGGRGVERSYRDVVAARAACPKWGPRKFLACLRRGYAMGDFDEGLVEIPKEPVRMAELRNIQEAVGKKFTTKGEGRSHAHNLRFHSPGVGHVPQG